MSYSPEDDGSDMDAATWIAMRDALIASDEALSVAFSYIVRGDNDLLSIVEHMTKAMELTKDALKHYRVKP